MPVQASPFLPDAIDDETVIDISHEALIRRWQRIADPARGWLQEEFRDGLIWRALLVQASQHFWSVRVGQKVADAFGKSALILRKAEIHQPAPARGRPSRRSAVMLRCTSFDPA